MSVYRVIDVVGTSTTSWEEAAADAINTARQSVRDLRVAEVVKQDIHVGASAALIAWARVAGRHRGHRRPAAAWSLTDDHLDTRRQRASVRPCATRR